MGLSAIHKPSFYLGCHSSIAILCLFLAPIAPWLLLTLIWSSAWAYHFWVQTQKESA